MDTSAPSPGSEPDGSIEQGWSPKTEGEREAVQRQLERLLADPAFAASRRYPRLLRYIVEETIAGRTESLKERTLGVEVFGRDPNYDTNQDPVVRTSAAHVRQRVAQYYSQPGREHELRIELRPGSYIPLLRPGAEAGGVTEPTDAETAAPEIAMDAPPAVAKPKWRMLAAAVFVVALLGAVSYWAYGYRKASDPVVDFWGPVWDKPNSIVICVPGKFPTPEAAAQPLTIHESLRRNSVSWPDATSLYAVVGFLQNRGQSYQVRRAGDSALSDFRVGPTVLIGGLNNEWLMRLSQSYRFSYQNDIGAGVAWIQDAQHPDWQDCKVEWNGPYSAFEEDYGIISRVWDSTTEQIVVTASGIASYGTIAAAEFLTSRKYLTMLARQAPAGWQRKSLQVVFSTRVFNGNAGPPHIIAIHVW